MIGSVLVLVIGFALLVKGADFFVEGASDIARKLGIPSIVIRPITVKRSVLKRDYVMSLLMTLLMLAGAADIFGNNGKASISLLDGAVLLGVTAGYMYHLIRTAVRNRVAEQFGITRPLPLSLLFCIGGAVAIIGGGQMVVNSATDLAYGIGMSETLVGLTIVAVGTSLPELVTSVVAARKGESEIALGNVLGSNILNIGFILGTSGVIHPITVGMENVYDMLILILLTAVFLVPLWIRQRVSRGTGAAMLGCYLGYMVYIVVR